MLHSVRTVTFVHFDSAAIHNTAQTFV